MKLERPKALGKTILILSDYWTKLKILVQDLVLDSFF